MPRPTWLGGSNNGESTPLVPALAREDVARVDGGDVEDAPPESRLGREFMKVDAAMSRVRDAVRGPVLRVVLVLLLVATIAVAIESDRFAAIAHAAKTVKGERVFEDDASKLATMDACDRAFVDAKTSDWSDRNVANSLSASATLERVFERVADGACVAARGAERRTTCVDAEAIERCATDMGVVLHSESIRNRYVLASVIEKAKRDGTKSFAYVDERANATGPLGSADRRALGVLLDSDRWGAVRLAYNASIAMATTDDDVAATCPHQCKCAFADGKLCELRTDTCALADDAFFALHEDAYDQVLRTLPHADVGVSVLANVFPQWIVVDPPFEVVRPRRRARTHRSSALGLPHACAEPSDVPAPAPPAPTLAPNVSSALGNVTERERVIAFNSTDLASVDAADAAAVVADAL